MIDLLCGNVNCRKSEKNPLVFFWIDKKRGNGIARCPKCGWSYLIQSGTLLYTAISSEEIRQLLNFCHILNLKTPLKFEQSIRKNMCKREKVEETYESRAKTWNKIRGFIKERKGEDNRILNLAQKFIKNKDSPLTIAELGVGTGWKMAELKKTLKTGSQIIALDISRQMCQQTFYNLEKIQNQVDVAIATCDVTKKTPLPPNCVDLVIIDKLLHHLKKPEKALNEVSRILKKGGKVLAMVPGTKYQLLFTVLKLKYASKLFPPPIDESPEDPLGRFSEGYLRKIFLEKGIIGFVIHSDFVFYTFPNLFSYFSFMDLTGVDARLFWHKRSSRVFFRCKGYENILKIPIELTIFCEFLTIEGEKV